MNVITILHGGVHTHFNELTEEEIYGHENINCNQK